MLALSLMKQLDFTMKLRTKHIFQQTFSSSQSNIFVSMNFVGIHFSVL